MDKDREMLLFRLARLMEEGDARPDGLESFADICRRRLGVSPSCMDEILFAELGLTGEEFFASYGGGVIDIGCKIC